MDKVRKYKSLYSSICNTFAVGEGETITPASVTGLPQDTEITLTFDRVDFAGNKTPAKMERIRGKVVGGNFVISQGGRGADGTTEQVHTAPVVEMIWNASDWNDLGEAFLSGHNQDGTHKALPYLSNDVIDTDPTLAANSNDKVASQKAIKAYAASKTGTETLTNKRINPRVLSATSYTTDTGTALDVSVCDEFIVTAQAGNLKFNNPTGTPVEGQKLIIRIKDNGTARALTYDTQFRASPDLALPNTTVAGKWLYMGFKFNATDTKWDLLAVLGNI